MESAIKQPKLFLS